MKGSFRLRVAYLFVAIFVAGLLTACSSGSTRSADQAADGASPMKEVLAKGRIRCGYTIYSSYFRRDSHTGELSGIFHDIMEEIGRGSGLKIEWSEEVGFENIIPGLDTNRYDVFAGGLWPNGSRARAASFTIPAFYSVFTPWVRADDRRFDKSFDLINSPDVKIATIDGAMEDLIAKSDFAKAKRLSLPELSPWSQNLLNVTTGKADVTFAEPMVVHEFMKANPRTLKELFADHPLRVFGNCLAVKRGNLELRDFLDLALKELVDSGKVDQILARYEPKKDTSYPVIRPYNLPPAINK